MTIPPDLWNRLEKILDCEKPSNNLHWELEGINETTARKLRARYKASLMGWIYPYDYDNPKRLLMSVQIVSFESIRVATQFMIEDAETCLTILQKHPNLMTRSSIPSKNICQISGHRNIQGEYCDRCKLLLINKSDRVD